ncbi:MAG: sulfotransferase domain-containing protein [Gemmatimonadota bacterium]
MVGPARALKLALTRAYSGSRRLFGSYDHQLVVCGYPRGGTSLIYNMLSATLPRFRFEEFEQPVIYRLHRLGNIASKYPLDVFNIKKLLSLNVHRKKLHVIVMIRDPRDLVTSRHPLLPDQYFIGHDHSWWPQDAEFGSWKFNAPGIVEIFREIEELGRQSEIPTYTVKYEDLVEEPNRIQQQLRDRFGLDFADSFADFHQHPEKMAYRYAGRTSPREASLVRENKPADRSRSGKWQAPQHRERIREQFGASAELLGIVRSHGYETSDDWLRRVAL